MQLNNMFYPYKMFLWYIISSYFCPLNCCQFLGETICFFITIFCPLIQCTYMCSLELWMFNVRLVAFKTFDFLGDSVGKREHRRKNGVASENLSGKLSFIAIRNLWELCLCRITIKEICQIICAIRKLVAGKNKN